MAIVGMNKPVYRYLLNRKWREMRRPVLMQRLTQMNVIPDVLPGVDPIVDVQVRFKGHDIRPGVFVKSKDSEQRPTFKIIPFRQGEQLCTVVIVDPGMSSCRYNTHLLTFSRRPQRQERWVQLPSALDPIQRPHLTNTNPGIWNRCETQ